MQTQGFVKSAFYGFRQIGQSYAISGYVSRGVSNSWNHEFSPVTYGAWTKFRCYFVLTSTNSVFFAKSLKFIEQLWTVNLWCGLVKFMKLVIKISANLWRQKLRLHAFKQIAIKIFFKHLLITIWSTRHQNIFLNISWWLFDQLVGFCFFLDPSQL